MKKSVFYFWMFVKWMINSINVVIRCSPMFIEHISGFRADQFVFLQPQGEWTFLFYKYSDRWVRRASTHYVYCHFILMFFCFYIKRQKTFVTFIIKHKFFLHTKMEDEEGHRIQSFSHNECIFNETNQQSDVVHEITFLIGGKTQWVMSVINTFEVRDK